MFQGAKWIWGEGDAIPDSYMEFLLPIAAMAGKRYRLCLAVDGDYALYAGGALAAFGQYADYPHHRVYDQLELTPFLQVGENRLRIVVWHMGVNAFTYIKKDAGLLFSLWEDDKKVSVSDASVLCRPAPGYACGRCQSITHQLGLTFHYDEHLPHAEYRPAAVVGESGVLYPRPNRKTVMGERMDGRVVEAGGYLFPENATHIAKKLQEAALLPQGEYGTGELLLRAPEHAEGVYAILDLGREACGFVAFSLDIPADCEIAVGWGEHLSDGRCRTDLGGRNFTFTYEARAGHVQFLHPFRRLGCRYLEIFAGVKEARVQYVGLYPVEYPLQEVPFSAGESLRDRIYATAVRTLRLCMHEHYEDCPWREQALYTLDSRNQMLCGYYAFGEKVFPRASLELISLGLRPDGLLSLCYPAGEDRPIPAFSLIYPMQMSEYWEHTRDLAFIAEKYPLMEGIVSLFWGRRGQMGLIPAFYEDPDHWNFYEWSEGMEGERRVDQNSLEAPLNAFLSLALKHMETMARGLGKEEDANRYEEQRKELNDAIRQAFYRPERGLFASYTDDPGGKYHVLTNSLCLLCGAAEGVKKQYMLQILAENGGNDPSLVPDTLSMAGFRYDALLREDRETYGEVILAEIDRVWGGMLEAGATSFWETAEGAPAFGGAGSLCHGWSAIPVYYYHKLLK